MNNIKAKNEPHKNIVEKYRELLQKEISHIEREIAHYEPEPYMHMHEFDDWLNEQYPVVAIEGVDFKPAEILRTMNEGAYIEGLHRFCSNYDKEQVPRYRELIEELEGYRADLAELGDE